MAVTNWPWVEATRDGIEGWEWTGKLFISKDYNPETGVAIAFFAPPGGRAAVPAMVQGDPGLPITIRNVITTEIEHDDPDPASMTFSLITPGSATVQPVYDVLFTVRKGTPGDPAAFNFLDADDLVGSPLAGYVPTYVVDTGLAIGEAATGLPGIVWSAPKVGDTYLPASIASTTSVNGAQRTLCPSQSIPAQTFAWRPRVAGQCIITGTGADVRVDLIARVNDASSGDIVGRAFGQSGITPPTHVLSAARPPGSPSDYGRIEAGEGPTVVYLRAERQSGADSFNTTGSTTSFEVKVEPLP